MSTEGPNPSRATLLAQSPSGVHQRRYFPSLALFVVSYAAYGLLLCGVCILPGWPLKAICVVGAALALSSFYILGHDAGHGCLVPDRRLNMWLARLAFLPTFAPLTAWYRAHVLLHHKYLRVRGRDMVWMPWSLAEYRRAPASRRAWYRFLRTPLGILFYWTVGNWVPYLLFPPSAAMGSRSRIRQLQFDRLLVGLYAIGLFVALYALSAAAGAWPWAEPIGPVGIVLLCLVLPYLIWSYLAGVVDLVHHSHPNAVCFNDQSEFDYFEATVQSSTHVKMPFGLDRLVHNIFEHSAHHVDPGVPLYHLSEMQARLETANPGDVPVERLSPSYVLRILRTCRLYDYQRRQWLDYDGTPTTAAQRPDPPSASDERASSPEPGSFSVVAGEVLSVVSVPAHGPAFGGTAAEVVLRV